MKISKVVISLHRLLGTKVMEMEYNGRMENYICIPMSPNGIGGMDNKYFLQTYMTPKFPNPKGQSHYLSLLFPKSLTSFRKEAEENGFKEQIKYVGNVYNGYEKFKERGVCKKLDLQKAMNTEG